MHKITFCEANELLNRIFSNTLAGFPNSILFYLLDFLSSFCKYEEEEMKIKPSLLVGININEHLSSVPNTQLITLVTNNIEFERTRSNLKSLIPLCSNGWIVFINFKSETSTVDYGVLRYFGGITAVPFIEMVFGEESDDEIIPLVLFTALSNYEILIKNYNNPDSIIDFRIKTPDLDAELNTIINYFSYDCTKAYGNNEEYSKCCKKVLRQAQERIHGTICAIIDKDSEVSDIGLFCLDSKIIPEPIDIIEFAKPLLLDTIIDPSLVEKYYAITGILTSLMNIDGICIIDTAFRIRAYNTFIKSDANEIAGGSRTRAFNTIKRTTDPNIVGCYFQSQDGKYEYWRNARDE